MKNPPSLDREPDTHCGIMYNRTQSYIMDRLYRSPEEQKHAQSSARPLIAEKECWEVVVNISGISKASATSHISSAERLCSFLGYTGLLLVKV
jgi:hypothetical protein